MGHRINLEGLLAFQREEKVLFASSSKEHKKLYIELRGNYTVYVNKELVLETMQAKVAIDKYNSF